MFLKLFLLCSLIVTSGRSALIAEEEGVLVLKKSNFDEALRAHPNLLVEFYAPWCGHCKALAPEYARAAGVLKAERSGFRLGKVDASAETELAKEHGVEGYPTIKLFRGGGKKSSPREYSYGRRAEDILEWIRRRSGLSVDALTEVVQAERMIADNEVAVVGFFRDARSDRATAFAEAAEAADDDVAFGMTSEEALYSRFQLTEDGVVLFKKFDEGRSAFDGRGELSSAAALLAFVKANRFPLVVTLNDGPTDAPPKALREFKDHVLLFASGTAPDFQDKVAAFRKAAEVFRGRILFVLMDVDVETNQHIMEFMGLEKERCPILRLLNLEVEAKVTQFKPDDDDTIITTESIVHFCTLYVQGKLEPHFKSQEVPDDWDKNPVRVLVGKNFKEVALDPTKSVFVKMYAPWCGYCKRLAPVWEQLGERYKDRQDVVVAKMDVTANAAEHVHVHSFPALKLFPAGDGGKVIDYTGERTLEGFVRFLESGGREEEEEEEDARDEL